MTTEAESPKCQGLTRGGQPCSRNATMETVEGSYCRTHAPEGATEIDAVPGWRKQLFEWWDDWAEYRRWRFAVEHPEDYDFPGFHRRPTELNLREFGRKGGRSSADLLDAAVEYLLDRLPAFVEVGNPSESALDWVKRVHVGEWVGWWTAEWNRDEGEEYPVPFTPVELWERLRPFLTNGSTT